MRNRLPHLLVIPILLVLLCAGWLQPALPHSCLLHEACGAMPCCAEKEAPAEARSFAQTACHDRTAPASDVHVPTVPSPDAHAQAALSQKDADCSTLLCFESQAPVVIALFEGMPVSDAGSLPLPPGDELFASLLHNRLFRPPIPAFLEIS